MKSDYKKLEVKMAFEYCLNFEKVSLEIIEEQISKMTDTNSCSFDDDYDNCLCEKTFIENLKHGSIAIVFIQNLFETSLNTILRKRAEISEMDILKSSISVKLQIISIIYGFDISTIKSDNSYSIYRQVEKIRNDITHFKSNILGKSTIVSSNVKIDLGTSKETLADIFTQKYMNKCYIQVLKLIELICSKCNLFINKNVQIIDSAGCHCSYEFIVDSKPTIED